MSLAVSLLLAWGAALTALLWACLAATRRHFRASPAEGGPLLPMTVIKPVRGWDDALEAGLSSLVEADPGGRLQILIALESEEDPAYRAASAFAAAHPDRDIAVAVTGPAGGRMGKMHNMIEALPRARHALVVFSDADAQASPELLRQTSRAFREGGEAVAALPVHPRGAGLGETLLQLAFHHYFCLPAPLSARVLGFPFFAGAWMGFTRELLDRMGGLEPLARLIADDYALSARAWSLGARFRLLPATVTVRETTRGAGQALERLSKWAAIIRWSIPGLYALVPCLSPVTVSLAAWALAEAGWGPLWPARLLAAAAAASRALVGRLQERACGAPRMPAYGYLLLALSDAGGLALWVAGLRRTVAWRGTVYRLSSGGRAEVVGGLGPRA